MGLLYTFECLKLNFKYLSYIHFKKFDLILKQLLKPLNLLFLFPIIRHKLSHQSPELCRVVLAADMRKFVDNNILDKRCRQFHQVVVERDTIGRRAGTPSLVGFSE